MSPRPSAWTIARERLLAVELRRGEVGWIPYDVGDMRSVKRSVLSTCALSSLIACAAQPSRVDESADFQTAELGMPLRDGNWRTFYPDGAHVLTEGRVRGGEKDGVWTIYYHHGSPFARGAFAKGELHGDWVVWKPDGSVSDERSATRCENFALMWCPAGSDYFPWSFFSQEQSKSVVELLPSVGGGWWDGTGHYEHGLPERVPKPSPAN